MGKRFLANKTAVFTTVVVLIVALIGVFAPLIAPNDPFETNIINKFTIRQYYSLFYSNRPKKTFVTGNIGQ